ncbi:hypothetical protein [Lacinutrix himadriensis]|uniref:hypothetical protein n=1 Tax=Lacinutrix himadriensis TaxID=641549 RepID=UPI0009FAAF25|nr:hypothetical protein [Lacinutrix himadriensis]
MKKTINLAMLLLFAFTLLSSTCSSDDDDGNSNNNSAEINAITNSMESGNWTITYFYDTDSDETSDFNGYTFNFATNGVLTATNGVNTYTGTWSVTDDSSSSSDSDIDFNIAFSSPPDFEELSDDWDIISYSSTEIKLVDISGGNGGTDYLTFQK